MPKRMKRKSRQSDMRFGKMVGREAFGGHLKPEVIAAGINLVRKNGRRLAQDARLMFEHKRYASALGLAVLAIEEQGKERMLRDLAVLRPAESPAELWKDFRDHLEKNRTWILPYVAADQPHPTLKSLNEAIFNENADHPLVLEWAKQTAIYVDCVGAGEWQDPEEMISESDATAVVQLAEVMQGSGKSISVEEITELVQLVRNGVTKETLRGYMDKWGHKGGLPVS
jgi:AbiV family abortive infection protein